MKNEESACLFEQSSRPGERERGNTAREGGPLNLKGWCAALICGLSVGAVCAADLPFEKIVQAASHPQEWLTYWGDYQCDPRIAISTRSTTSK